MTKEEAFELLESDLRRNGLQEPATFESLKRDGYVQQCFIDGLKERNPER